MFKNKLFETAHNHIDNIAVSTPKGSYTYRDCLKLSTSFRDLNSIRRIGLYFEKSKEYIISVFAATLSDTTFIPIDINLPKDRVEYIINDAEVEYVLTSKLVDTKHIPKNVQILYIENLLDNDLLMVQSSDYIDESAYIIYTSGSTGTPKGVEVTYSGLYNVIAQQVAITNMDASNFYLYVSISFDASLSDIYCSFLSGSTIYINDSIKHNMAVLLDYFNTNNITHSDLPPSILKLLKPKQFNTLESIIIGGEVADYKSVQSFAKHMNVINVYGPTEATICTSMIKCDPNWNKPLIGLPLTNVGYYVYDDKQLITSDMKNQVGELVITGCQLAKGYINKSELNAKSFVTMYINGKDVRCYRTGDYVFYNDNGLLEFKGRIDRQIKHYGQLINLEEVETVVKSITDNASVIYKDKKIYAYYEGDISSEDIRNKLTNILPLYMIPTFIINKNIPKTITGKNDSKLLKLDDSKNDELNTIIGLMGDILGIDSINSNDSFIENLGASSIDFINLQMKLQEIGINISYDYLIKHNTPNDIIQYQEDNKVIDTTYLINEYNNLEKPNNIRPIENNDKKVALVTGTTGLLGSLLLSEIVFNDVFDKVYCVVRGYNGIERIKKAALQHDVCIDFTKVVIINGDLTEPNCGIDNYNDIVNEVDTVYHCAANVNNILSYDQLFDSNVLSTINISKLVFDGKVKELHYASTLSVYVSSDKLDDSVFYELELFDMNHKLYSGYAQTKWLSEYYLEQINKQSNNMKFYRFGLLTPSTNKPVLSNSFLKNCIDDIKDINELPINSKGLSMDITPVDIAVNAMYDISMSDKKKHIFHVTTNYQLTLDKMAKLLNVDKYIDNWFEKHNGSKLAQHMVDLDSNKMKQHNMNIFETTNIDHFDTSNSREFMVSFDIETYLKELIR